MKSLKSLILATIFSIGSLANVLAQNHTSSQDSLLSQLQEVEILQNWANENLFAGMFDKSDPISMMIFTDNSVLTFNPDSTLLSIFNPKEIGTTENGKLYYLTNEVNPNFMMMTMGAPYEQGAYEKPWYYTKPWVFCSSYNQAKKLVPGISDKRDWYTMLLHEYTHVWQQRHPKLLTAISNFEQLYGGPEVVSNLHKQDSTLYSALKAENDALIAALESNNRADEDSYIAKFHQLRKKRKQQMIDNGYPEELVRFCDMQELTEGQARFIEYNVGRHLGLYEDNDSRWGDINSIGWFHATGFNLCNLLRKQGFNMSDAYTEEIHPLDYYLK